MSRILLLHNYYQQSGGEDAVFEAEVEMLKNHGHFVETLTFHNQAIQGIPDHLLTGLQGIYNWQAAKKLENRIRIFHPDIVHVHNFFPLASPAIFRTTRRKLGIPTVMTLHNYRLICANALLYRDGQICETCIPERWPLEGIMHGCYRHSRLQSAALTAMSLGHRWLGTWQQDVSRFITLTDFAREKFLQAPLGLSPDQLVTKPNFVPDYGEGDYHAREPFFIFIGRLTPEKGVPILLETFSQLEIPLKVIGGGPLEETIRQVAMQHKHIEMLGPMQRAEILPLLKKAKALIFPSTWYEGFPMTILESLVTGTPVLASKIGGLPEIIRHGENGLHFQPGSTESLIKQINLLHQEEALHHHLCLNARKSYLSRYTPDVNYQQLATIYGQLLDEWHAKPKNPVF